eukprot:m.345567 g.345567  ORF g.345567 m.345567 type:complete len:204 (+) comp26743_c0_seq1:266-877(+)
MAYLRRLWGTYTGLLASHPLQTNTVSAGVIGFFGDCAAQAIEQRQTQSKSLKIDWIRTWKVASWGFLAGGVPLFYWFRFLDRKFPLTAVGKRSQQDVINMLKKTAVNQIFAATLNNGGFYCWIVFCDRQLRPEKHENVTFKEEATHSLEKKMPPTMKRSFLLWGTAHLFNFWFLPPQYRVLFNSTGQVLWMTYLSITGHKRDI